MRHVSSRSNGIKQGKRHAANLSPLTCSTPILWKAPWAQFVTAWKKLQKTLLSPSNSIPNTSNRISHDFATYIQTLDFRNLWIIVNDAFVSDLIPLLPNLQHLYIAYPKSLADSGILSLAHRPPPPRRRRSGTIADNDSGETALYSALSTLSLVGCTRFSSVSFQQFILMCPSLTTLNLADGCRIDDECLLAMSRFQLLCTTLKVLNLSHAAYITDRGLAHFLSKSPNLTSVTLQSCKLISDISVIALCGNASAHVESKLTHLNVSYCIHITDASLRALADSFPLSLTYLDVLGCLQITEDGIQYIVRHGKALSKIRIEDQYGGVSRAFLRVLEGERDKDQVRFVRDGHEVGRETMV